MIRKLLKTKDNNEQVKFIIMCSGSNWILHNKVLKSKLVPRQMNKSYEFMEFFAGGKKYIRKS